jgi:mxaC protein
MSLGFDSPALLWLLALAFLPMITRIFRHQSMPSLLPVPNDVVSDAINILLAGLGVLTITATVLGLAGLHHREQFIAREGNGAHLVLLLDRSSSMNDSFSGHFPGEAEESKSAAAKRLLTDFVIARPHDHIAVAAFSTSPLPVLPMSNHLSAVLAAVAAIDRPGLAFTDVGRGLALGLSLFDNTPFGVSRALLLVSDGAAVIDHHVQAALLDAIRQTPIHLYWLYLRSAGAPGLFDSREVNDNLTPRANPERNLHEFFGTLGVPYRAFEARNPETVREAITEIDRLETRSIEYFERIPRRDLSRIAYAIAGLAAGFLTIAKFLEQDLTWNSRVTSGEALRGERPRSS